MREAPRGAPAVSMPLDDLRRAQRTMIIVRWVAVPWAVVQTLAYEQPFPRGARVLVLAVIGLLAAGNALVSVLTSRDRARRRAPFIAAGGLALDTFVTSAIVWIFAFDQTSALWAILFIIPLEGAVLFQLNGALGAWAAVALVYTAREIWGSGRYDYPLLWNSITFRMGVGLFIALVAGLMSRDLLRQRTRLLGALEELRRVDAMRSGLVSMLAHDVRGPLAVIRGTVKTLLSYRERVDWQRARELLEVSDRQAARLEQLATDLLDLARLEEGRLQLDIEDVPVADAIQEGLSYLEDPAAAFDVDVQDGLRVRADRRRLQQVIVNLATNAVRYGQPPLRIRAAPRDGGVAIEFSDAGPGIPPEGRASLFEPFVEESGGGSVGLGLPIVKALTEAQGGTVSYQPNEPRGACFTVTLPSAG